MLLAHLICMPLVADSDISGDLNILVFFPVPADVDQSTFFQESKIDHFNISCALFRSKCGALSASVLLMPFLAPHPFGG